MKRCGKSAGSEEKGCNCHQCWSIYKTERSCRWYSDSRFAFDHHLHLKAEFCHNCNFCLATGRSPEHRTNLACFVNQDGTAVYASAVPLMWWPWGRLTFSRSSPESHVPRNSLVYWKVHLLSENGCARARVRIDLPCGILWTSLKVLSHQVWGRRLHRLYDNDELLERRKTCQATRIR